MRRIVFDPQFAKRLSEQELVYVLIHEVLHCALKHCTRGAGKQHFIYNVACDIVVNSIILKMFDRKKLTIDGENMMHTAPDGKEGREILRGEIYEYMSAKGEYRTALVVGSNDRANDRVISVLLLSEEQRGNYTVPVVCGQMMYTHCDMVSYAFEDRLGNYVRTATDAEMEAVDNMIADALGLSVGYTERDRQAWKAEIEQWKRSCAEADERYHNLETEYNRILAKMHAELDKAQTPVTEEAIRIQVERDMYKMFYEDIIRKIGG
jgi:mRNA-degrading endonuclease toxin of MazEF toxin-antitoxin module